MKALNVTIFAVLLLLGQWGSLDHVYHEHDSSEVCDYCIQKQGSDQAVEEGIQPVIAAFNHCDPSGQYSNTFSNRNIRGYEARAPPRSI